MSKTGRTFSSASSERPHFQHPALQALQDEGADDEGASQYSLFSSTSGDLVSHNGSHLGRQRESGSGTPSEVPASGARRFSTTHSTHPPVLAPASYSATQSSIRNSTARLADFAARPLHSTSASDYRIDSTPSSPANHSMFASTRHYSDTQATGVDRSSDVNKDLAQLGLSQKHQPGTSPGGTGPSGLALMLQSNSPPASGLDDTTSPGMAIQIDPPREEDEADEREDDWSPSTSVTPKASKMTVLPEPKSSSYRKGSALSALVERDQETSRGSRLAPSDIVEEDSDISNTTEASSSGKKLSTSSVAAGNQGGNERTHLLARHDEHAQDSSNGLTETDPESFGKNRESGLVGWWREMSTGWEKPTGKTLVENCVVAPTKALPAVMLGLLLNLLDGVSYALRMIMFPSNAIFPDFGVVGVSMFFMSCIVSQLTFTLGGSIFKAGNGSMMIEAVPFFHILVNTITAEVGEENPHVIIATTMAAFAFSSFLTGAVFFGLGKFKLGALVGFFPRSILIGAIGGVGVFLIETGLEVAAGIEGEGIDFTHNTYVQLFGSAHNVLLWAIPLFLALFLRLISLRYTHELVFPAYFLVVPIIFYIVIAIIGVDFETLRKNRWVFEVGQVKEPWYTFYSYYDFRQVHWGAFWKSMSTQFALVFFGILHVPLNVPALGVSLCEDNVKLDRELIAHGYSNILSGCVGSVPNYLCYVNTVLFYRVGGGTRLAALMLAAATAGIMVAGPSVIGFLPIMVVAALIFVLGLDLAKEAVWDTRHKVNRWEYVTIVAITIGMTIWDFVIGLFIGIVMACIFFVIQNSKRRAIRAAFNGSVARSTVRRPASQSAFIKDVGRQTQVVKLQGFLFFGTISAVEGEIRNMLDIAVWQHNPIRFLIVDLWLVYGLDLSSAEAFVRIQRLLEAKGVVLVFCGCHPEGVVGKALQAVELWSDQGNNSVQVVDTLNDALEWTENNYLSAFYGAPNRKLEQQPAAREFNIASSQVPFSLGESHENSPRRKHLVQAGDLTFKSSDIHLRHEPSSNGSLSPNPTLSLAPPLPTLLKTFRTYTDLKEDFWFQLVPYLESVHAKQGQILWSQGDEPDGMYLIESGMLRAVYEYAEHTRLVQETMVSGVVAGELSTLAGTPRNATVTVEVPSVLWKLDNTKLEKLQKNHPKVAAEFIRILLKITSQEHDVLSAHLMTTLS